MEFPQPLPESEAADWFARTRQTDVFTELFEQSDQDVTTAESIPDNGVTEHEERLNVNFHADGDDGFFTSVVFSYDKESHDLVRATLQTGQVVAPLAGRGTSITYEDGVYTEGSWVS